MNDKNLKPLPQRSMSEQREIRAKGGVASGEARRRKRDLRLALENLLEKDFKDKDGKTISGTEALAVKLFEQAMKGNIKAFETVRDTVGQKPIDKLMIAEVDQSVVDEVERMVLDDDEGTGDQPYEE